MINVLTTLLSLCVLSTVHSDDREFIKKRVNLRDSILRDYTSTGVKVRPSNETKVYVTLALTSLRELDIESQTLSTTFYLHLSWFDGRLTWTPDTKDDQYFLFDIKEVWTPNFVIDNFIEDNGLLGIYDDGPIPLRVSYNGSVLWVLRISTTTICRADITFYPYDIQRCHIDITEWAYTSSEVNLIPAKTDYYPDEVYDGRFTEDGEWILMSKYVREQEVIGGFGLVYENLNYTFVFERRPQWYIPVLMIPLCVMSILMSGVFLVPVKSGEKLTYSLTVMLSFTVILSFISHTLPSVSSTISLLGVYIAAVLATSSLVIAITAVVLYLHHKMEKESLADTTDKLCFVFFFVLYLLMMITFAFCFHLKLVDTIATLCIGIILPILLALVALIAYVCWTTYRSKRAK